MTPCLAYSALCVAYGSDTHFCHHPTVPNWLSTLDVTEPYIWSIQPTDFFQQPCMWIQLIPHSIVAITCIPQHQQTISIYLTPTSLGSDSSLSLGLKKLKRKVDLLQRTTDCSRSIFVIKQSTYILLFAKSVTFQILCKIVLIDIDE